MVPDIPTNDDRVEKILRENANVSLYENVFIARQDVSTAQVDGLIETFEKIISNMGGSVPKKESWGLRTMAYKIKKNRKGHYVLMNIDAPGEAIQEMEHQMHLHEDVLRYLTTRVDELEEGPSAVLRAKERNDDRGRRDGRDDHRGTHSSRNDGPSNKPADKEKDAEPKEAKAKEETPDEAKEKTPDEAKEKTPDEVKVKEETSDDAPKETPADDDAEKDEGDAK